MAENSYLYKWEILVEPARERKTFWRVTFSSKWSNYWLSWIIKERITKIINKVDIEKFGYDHTLIRIFIKEKYGYFIQNQT